jgi:hypothetical protein
MAYPAAVHPPVLCQAPGSQYFMHHQSSMEVH